MLVCSFHSVEKHIVIQLDMKYVQCPQVYICFTPLTGKIDPSMDAVLPHEPPSEPSQAPTSKARLGPGAAKINWPSLTWEHP